MEGAVAPLHRRLGFLEEHRPQRVLPFPRAPWRVTQGGCRRPPEVDAITWHAADAGNPYGPGVEWERNVIGGLNDEGLSEAEPLTDNQLEWGARLVDFFAEWGIPAELYDGPRYGESGWRGWVNHQAIDSSRSDGLTRAEWDQISGPGEPPVDWAAIAAWVAALEEEERRRKV